MKSWVYIDKIHHQLAAAFVSQDPELFDIVFEIEGKKLYADKLILSLNSSTFKSMLSTKDEIKIETYKFEDFKELLTFIYTGECNLTNKNIFIMLDMSEFYQIEDLKELCIEFLSNTKLNFSKVLQLLKTSNSLIQIKGQIQTFIFQNFANLAKFDGFLNADKSIIKKIKKIVAMESNLSKHHEEMFRFIYKWAENQVIKKQQFSNDETFNMNDAIKVEMQEFHFLKIKKYFDFKKMKLNFLHEFVVKITNSHGKSIYCDLSPKQKREIKILKSLNGRESDNDHPLYIFWDKPYLKPSTPSLLKKRNDVQWYLIYIYDFDDLLIGVKHYSDLLEDDYLIAEMFAEKDFDVTRYCKIKIE
uniref:BTB domain-containing protein n=1 Tax=Panagrolaimus davidi TaxID=227884 RepID=A0A914QU98_9BILA